MRFVSIVALTLGLALAGFVAFHVVTQPADPAHTRSAGLTIEQVRKLASLVVLDVPISDVHVTQLEGLTGGIKVVIAVHGDVQIATDLSKARFEDLDAEHHTATLVLPKPAPGRPRLNHEKTRIVAIERNGLWNILPGEAGEKAATNRAMSAAQQLLTDAAKRDDLAAKACAHADEVLRSFFTALGWTVTLQWQ
jgi:hypothetical protein